MEWSRLPEDTELKTRFESNKTIHYFTDGQHPLHPTREVWKTVKTIGHGGFSCVCLEECIDEQGMSRLKRRAVKAIRLSQGVDMTWYARELEASAKFSQKKVCR